MTEQQWDQLNCIINGELQNPLPVSFIIDSPWLPNWAEMTIRDYFTHDESWFKANLKAVQTFPDVIFLPGFWSEFGMCSEPSAFGAKCRFPENEFPHAEKCILHPEMIDDLQVPNPETDGLAPFILNRLVLHQSKIQEMGHSIRFSVSRGPLNIASYLMGVPEFLTLMMTDPDKTHQLLDIVTRYLQEWHDLQHQTFQTIDGIFLLDDILGFIAEEQFREFALPCLKRLYDRDLSVKFLHNDANCASTVPFLEELGVNLFNMGFKVNLNQLKKETNNQITLVGNIPPRDVLAQGELIDVQKATLELLESLDDPSCVLFSCGGGMPPGVSTDNIRMFIETVHTFHK